MTRSSPPRGADLLHYSSKPLGVIDSIPQQKEPDHKPRGLWFSVGDGEDGWRAWCEVETFGLARLALITPIILKPSARVLWLRGGLEIDAFSREYGCGYPFLKNDRGVEDIVDWGRVAKAHDGIIIAPYVWSRRLDGRARWYYGWDCASGCIWNADAAQAGEARRAETRGDSVHEHAVPEGDEP
jgi:hypothetical protein